MALGAEVVDLIGLHLLDDPDQVGAVCEVAVVELQLGALALAAGLVGILIEVVDSLGVEAAGPALDAMHAVALFQQQLGQVGAILAGDAGDQGGFAGGIARGHLCG